ncbi:LANO_0H24300g1_1 [Lachancea nothofagi CBS 11611]|uniref:LANO_0H24300g1_1 n=1 Tax=Lachancea nothofagi CBS 11611 TaxID=1266666 RepID=A0A1G4KNS2_9SACH|nr:LANO_0H24300g1_1 [Lachancea nothofagi CBS 11611]
MAASTKHRKFDEEEEALKDVPADIPENNLEEDSSDEDSASDDEAPEEEGVSGAKTYVEKQESVRRKAAEREQELIKEKRRKQNQKFAEQQDQKRTKEMQEFESQLKLRELDNVQGSDEESLPEELPEDFFENLDEQDTNQITTKPSHVNFNDIDENYTAEIKEELKKQKKKTLRQLRKTNVKRGPVRVNLLASVVTSRSSAPQKDGTVLNKKDKWLKRKSLARK